MEEIKRRIRELARLLPVSCRSFALPSFSDQSGYPFRGGSTQRRFFGRREAPQRALKGPSRYFSPKLDFLDCLKACAERAELDKDNFWLHKFRATFATRCLWAGVDLRTVQQWLGHSDMESTVRYLKPSRSEKRREKVNKIFA